MWAMEAKPLPLGKKQVLVTSELSLRKGCGLLKGKSLK